MIEGNNEELEREVGMLEEEEVTRRSSVCIIY